MYSYRFVYSVLDILFHCVVLCIVCVYMCTVLLPLGVKAIAVNKYIIYHIIYHIISYIISYHIISYHVMSCHVTSRHVMSCHVMSRRVVSCHVIYHVMSCHIIYYIIIYNTETWSDTTLYAARALSWSSKRKQVDSNARNKQLQNAY